MFGWVGDLDEVGLGWALLEILLGLEIWLQCAVPEILLLWGFSCWTFGLVGHLVQLYIWLGWRFGCTGMDRVWLEILLH